MTEELSIRFRAVEGSPHIRQEPAYGKSVLTIPKEHPQQGRVVAVYIDGRPQKFRVNEFGEVVVNHFRLEGGYVHVVCLVPKEPVKLPQDIRTAYPTPTAVYGLQRPIDRNPRGSQWVPQ